MLVGIAVFSQSKWKAQDDFHAVMSKTFHSAEEGNLQPIKMRSAELAAKADAWRKAEIPAFVSDKKVVKKGLNTLCKQAKALNKHLKKGASDAELKTELNTLHDTYHKIIEHTGGEKHGERH